MQLCAIESQLHPIHNYVQLRGQVQPVSNYELLIILKNQCAKSRMLIVIVCVAFCLFCGSNAWVEAQPDPMNR